MKTADEIRAMIRTLLTIIRNNIEPVTFSGELMALEWVLGESGGEPLSSLAAVAEALFKKAKGRK